MKSRHLVTSLSGLALALALPLAAHAQGQTPAQPSQGTTPTQSSAPAKEQKATHKASKASSARMTRVDLNTATKEELMKEPGVSDEIADKIIAARPFKSRSELLSKKIVTKVEYDKLRAHVMVKTEHPAASKSK